jgi:phage gpG-like protein
MARVTSNLADFSARLNALADTFDLTRDGLGETVLGVVADGIVARNADQKSPDGGEWAANRGKYGDRKRKAGLPVGVGIKKGGVGSGAMLSQEQIVGARTVEPQSATMQYGTDDVNKRKASWFTRGSDGPGEGEPSGAPGQPARPFYELTADDEDAMRAECEDHLARTVRELGG